jgi:hypothetical protein
MISSSDQALVAAEKSREGERKQFQYGRNGARKRAEKFIDDFYLARGIRPRKSNQPELIGLLKIKQTADRSVLRRPGPVSHHQL